MKPPITIQLTNISKKFILHPEKPTFIESVNPFKKPVEFWALKDINLTVYQGDRLGIVGANGAGKTTLLKIIAGITKPTSGKIFTSGRIISLIELMAGFQPDLNGIENIYLNGMILGTSKTQLTSHLNDIISFADIGDFIRQPLYTYSQGMRLRLGFAIAVHCLPDILIIDENLSLGDANFQKKCTQLIYHLIRKKITLLLCDHSQAVIKLYCRKTILLSNAVIDGPAHS